MAIRKNSKRTVEVIQQLVRWKNERTGIFANSSLPETLLPKGVEKGSYEQIMFITMCSSIDYQRDADALWDAGRDTWNDENTRWVFFPNLVKQKTPEDLSKDLQTFGVLCHFHFWIFLMVIQETCLKNLNMMHCKFVAT